MTRPPSEPPYLQVFDRLRRLAKSLLRGRLGHLVSEQRPDFLQSETCGYRELGERELEREGAGGVRTFRLGPPLQYGEGDEDSRDDKDEVEVELDVLERRWCDPEADRRAQEETRDADRESCRIVDDQLPRHQEGHSNLTFCPEMLRGHSVSKPFPRPFSTRTDVGPDLRRVRVRRRVDEGREHGDVDKDPDDGDRLARAGFAADRDAEKLGHQGEGHACHTDRETIATSVSIREKTTDGVEERCDGYV